jgi:1,4-alpha-glucan branching enzyme
MRNQPVFSLIINAHIPWVAKDSDHEADIFESIVETYLPLLEVFDRFDADRTPFHIGLSLSPSLCCLLSDERLMERCLAYMDNRAAFGLQEIERLSAPQSNENEEERIAREVMLDLARRSYEEVEERRIAFTERYEKNPLKAIQSYLKKGNIELLATAATHAFLPFYTARPEAVQAQIETAVSTYRYFFGRYPMGFWLPELGWSPEMDSFLRAYNFGYTICDSHAFILGNPIAPQGTFYPIKTPSSVFIMARNFYAARNFEGEEKLSSCACYRDNTRDAGYELPLDALKPFFSKEDSVSRSATGYKYWSRGKKQVYDYGKARERTKAQARAFLEKCAGDLKAAEAVMNKPPICLCTIEADAVGRFWYEGAFFIETLFREAQKLDMGVMSPGEYLYNQDSSDFATIMPSFSASGANGYAETWLDSSNDWMYRHMIRAVERMTELAERFPNESGIKERALNQAAREVLLAQDSILPKSLYYQRRAEYNGRRIEESMRNFTTIYESLGSGHISTEWLTNLERVHNIFPYINYRIFRKKR